MVYAHSLPDQPETAWQTLEAHHAGVYRPAAGFASGWGAPETARPLGNIHDTGKRSAPSSSVCAAGPVVWITVRRPVSTSCASGEEARPDAGRLLARLLAYLLLGHHGGMPDHGAEAAEGTLAWRLYGARARGLKPLPACAV